MSDFGYKKMKIADPYPNPNDWKDWSGLPRNILFDIMDRLTVIEDYVRFGAVCRSWRSIFVEESPANTNKHCSQPFLFGKSGKQKARLYSLSTNRKYKNFHFHWPNYTFFHASSFGWLVRIEKNYCDNTYKVQLQNPFLSKDYIVDLPRLDTVGSHGYISKTVLSSNPSFSRCFVVVAIRHRGLVFCKLGDLAWTPVGIGQDPTFRDVVFFNKTKQFYALRRNGQVVALDFEREPTLVQVMPPITLIGTNQAYLVEDLSGDLLQVVYKSRSDAVNYGLEVFKLDLVHGKWTEVHNLGDCILFMSRSGMIARSLPDCPGCERNCIYMTANRFWGPCSRKKLFCVPPGVGVYSLEDHTVLAHRSVYPPHLPEPFWLEPTLLPSMYGA